MSDIKVSVIVPVYNTEKYLPACLDSVLSQTLQDFEVIVNAELLGLLIANIIGAFDPILIQSFLLS